MSSLGKESESTSGGGGGGGDSLAPVPRRLSVDTGTAAEESPGAGATPSLTDWANLAGGLLRTRTGPSLNILLLPRASVYAFTLKGSS
jgi:hypothetical protein